MFNKREISSKNAFKGVRAKGVYEAFLPKENEIKKYKAVKSFWEGDRRASFLDTDKISEDAIPPRFVILPSNAILMEVFNEKMEEEFWELVKEYDLRGYMKQEIEGDKKKFHFIIELRSDFCIMLRVAKKFISKLDPIFPYLEMDIVKMATCIHRKRGVNFHLGDLTASVPNFGESANVLVEYNSSWPID